MKIKIVIGCLMSITLLIVNVPNAFAEGNAPNFLQFAKNASEVQVSLSEKGRSISKIEEKLSPYFTETFIDQFIEENIVETEEGYQTLGSDFALYYIPYFSYSDRTKLVEYKDQVYIVENFDEQEGPVAFPESYQGVRLTKEDGWKIADVLWVVPREIIKKAQSADVKEFEGKSGILIAPLISPISTIHNIIPVFWQYKNEVLFK